MTSLRYTTKNNALTSSQSWTLDGASLRIENLTGGTPRIVPLSSIRSLRLDFAPTRPERNRYRCTLQANGFFGLEFFNRSYKAPYIFTDTSGEYVEFVRALHAALIVHAPRCRYHAGASVGSYALNVLATGWIALCFAAISWFLARVNLTWMIAIKIALLLFYMPVLVHWLHRNRPREYEPESIPPDVLPVVPVAITPPPLPAAGSPNPRA